MASDAVKHFGKAINAAVQDPAAATIPIDAAVAAIMSIAAAMCELAGGDFTAHLVAALPGAEANENKAVAMARTRRSRWSAPSTPSIVRK